MPKGKLLSRILLIIGSLCIIAGAVFVVYNMYDDARAATELIAENEKLEALVLSPEAAKRRAASHEPEPHTTPPDPFAPPTAEPTQEPRDMTVLTVDGTDYVAMLSIPALGLEFSVRSEWSYPGLKKSPCRFSGSAYNNDLVICAHNYSSHFGRLRELNPGDEVLLVDMDGVLFTYHVELVEVLEPYETIPMIESEYELTLFTCTVGGEHRVTVRCSLDEVIVPQY